MITRSSLPPLTWVMQDLVLSNRPSTAESTSEEVSALISTLSNEILFLSPKLRRAKPYLCRNLAAADAKISSPLSYALACSIADFEQPMCCSPR